MLIGSRSKSPLIFCMLFPAMETTYRSLTECVCDEGSNPAKATRRPSGETTGFDHAPGLVTRSWIVPVATSTRYNCEVSRGICRPLRIAIRIEDDGFAIRCPVDGCGYAKFAGTDAPFATRELLRRSTICGDDKQMH